MVPARTDLHVLRHLQILPFLCVPHPTRWSRGYRGHSQSRISAQEASGSGGHCAITGLSGRGSSASESFGNKCSIWSTFSTSSPLTESVPSWRRHRVAPLAAEPRGPRGGRADPLLWPPAPCQTGLSRRVAAGLRGAGVPTPGSRPRLWRPLCALGPPGSSGLTC